MRIISGLRKLILISLAVLSLSCSANPNLNPNPIRQQTIDTRQYFVVTEECFAGQRVGDKDRNVHPCEYYPVLGYTTHGEETYRQISINDTQFMINDKHGEIAWGTANIEFICQKAQEKAKERASFVAKNEQGPFLFDIKELKTTDSTREFEIYAQDAFDRYYILENNCNYNSEMRFKCKDANGNDANYYIPGIIPPNKFNISEYRYFGKFTENGFYNELDRLTRQKWEAEQKAQQEADEKKLRAEKDKEKARSKKEEENRIAKIESLRSAGCPLAIETWNWGRSSEHYVTINGKLMNLTEKRITHVKVHVELLDKGGNFITSGWSYLQYPVLMPYQSSPFQIIERWNPLMARASIRIQMPTGEMIQGSCAMGK